MIFHLRDLLQDPVDQHPDGAGVDFARRLIDGHDAARVQGGIGLVVVAREVLQFGVHDLHLAPIAVELDLAEQRDTRAGQEPVRQVSSMEPLTEDDGARGVGELRFEQADIAPAHPGHLRGSDFGDDGRQFTGRELRDRLQVAAVLVPEREVVDQIFHGFQTARLQHGAAGGSDPFQVGQRSIESEGQVFRISLGKIQVRI